MHASRKLALVIEFRYLLLDSLITFILLVGLFASHNVFFLLYVQFLPATEISYQFENVYLECFHFGGVAWWIVFATPFDSNVAVFSGVFVFLLSISCWAEFNCLIMFRFKIVSFRDVGTKPV